MKNIFYLFAFLFTINISYTANAKVHLQVHITDSLKHYSVNELKKLGFKYYYTNVDLARIYAQEVLNRGIENNIENAQADGYYMLGIIDVLKGNQQNSLRFFDKGIQVSEKIQDQNRLLKLYLVEGNTYLQLDNYKQAIVYYDKTIAIAKELKKTEYEIIGYLNIALIKKEIGQFTEALKIEKENIKRAEKINFSSQRTPVSLLINLSGTFLNLKENDSSIYYAKKGLLLSTKAKDIEGSSYLYNIIGAAYQNKKKDSIALEYFYKSLALIKTFQNDKRASATYYLLAKSYAALKNQKKAIAYLHTAENLIASIENFQSNELTETYKLLAELYFLGENRQLANHYYQKYIESDSIKDANTTHIIGDLYYKDLKKQQQQLQKVSRQKYSLQLLLTIGALLSLIILAIAIFFIKKYKTHKKRFDILYQKTIQSAKKIIKYSNYKMSDQKTLEVLKKLEDSELKEYFLKPEFSLHFLAKKLGTNPSYLSKIINTNKQKQFSEYTNELRISYAINRLKANSKFRAYSILHISIELGYKSPSSFSKHFKKQTGIFPSEFITKINSENFKSN
ncbi:helix-turn-helix domain-containing protein [Flavobacteriaceae bacterium R38]|nr:helix-turn-helix domain-containing protein [Flavobacteriaceae bacterium R38]